MKRKKTGGRRAGTRNKSTGSVKEAAGRYTEEAIETLYGIMCDPQAPTAARVGAARELLDRAHGKAPQALTGRDGGDLTMTIKTIVHEHHPEV